MGGTSGIVGRWAGWAAVRLGATAVIAFMVFPLLYMVLLSLDPDPVGAQGWPPRISLVNYLALASPDLGFARAIGNSLLLSTGTTLVSIALAVPAAYALARLPVPGAGRILPAMLALAFFPGVILLVTLSRIFTAIGVYDRLPGIGIAQLSFALPLAVWFLTYAFSQVPNDLTDAARLDGAGTRQILLRVVLPIARPGVAATVAVVFLASWSDFLFSTGLSQTPRSETLLVLLSKLPVLGFLGGQMAAGVLMSVPVAVVVGALLVWLDRRTAHPR